MPGIAAYRHCTIHFQIQKFQVDDCILDVLYVLFYRTLAEYCPKLRALKVKHCHNVAESSLSILRSRGVELDVEPPFQRALVLLQDVVGFAPFINLQI